MSNYTTVSDQSAPMGYIKKEDILKYVTEEEIYELVIKTKPEKYVYMKNPLRADGEGTCWFEEGIDGRLVFKDFAYGNRPLDCFDFVQIYFKMPNFYQTLVFIKRTLIDGKGLSPNIKHIKVENLPQKKRKNNVELLFQTRQADSRDKDFWYRYGITSNNLIEDQVFLVKALKVIYKDGSKPNLAFIVEDICYVYAEFDQGRKKFYRPAQKGRIKFITNCRKDDIGGLKTLAPMGRQVVIAKAYKDSRVLKNQGLNSVWFQNEGMIPSDAVLLKALKNYEEIIVFFDNDEAGRKASIKVLETLHRLKFNAREVHLPFELLAERIKDPSDHYFQKGRKALLRFLKENKLIKYKI